MINNIIYSDFDINFKKNALTGDVIKKNNLEDISGIGSLTSLERLIIKYSEVDNISELSNLKNLEYLDLEKNKINRS